MNSSNVISIGEALIDRLGPPGGDPTFDNPVTDCFGGAPANVACALSRLGVNVSFIGSLGTDPCGNKFKNLMIDRGINIIGLQQDEFRPTRVVLVRRDVDGERTFGGFEGDNGFGFVQDWPLVSHEAKWLIIGTIPLASETASKAFLWCIEKALDDGIKIAIDLNWRPTFWRNQSSKEAAPSLKECNIIKPILNNASVIKLAKEEAQWFFNSSNAAEISLTLPRKPSVIVTDGANSINWLLNNNIGNTNAISPPSIVDTTGAGDAFTAGLIYKLLSVELDNISYDIAVDIIRFAIGCGAYVCKGVGAIESQPYREDVEKFLSSHNGGIS